MVTSRRRSLAAFAAVAGIGALAACNAVFGITDAALDPSLGSGGATASSSTRSSTASTGGATGGGGGGGGGGGAAPASTGTGGAGTGGDGGGVPVLSCANYCHLVVQYCPPAEAYGEYLSEQVCLNMCKYFDTGFEGETSGDSIGCRLVHTLLAKDDPVNECPKAGPLAVSCTDPCSAFCLETYNQCNGIGEFPYTDTSDCETQCGGFPYLTASGSSDNGDLVYATNLDSLNCRVYHLENAYLDDADQRMFHCPHTSPVNGYCHP